MRNNISNPTFQKLCGLPPALTWETNLSPFHTSTTPTLCLASVQWLPLEHLILILRDTCPLRSQHLHWFLTGYHYHSLLLIIHSNLPIQSKEKCSLITHYNAGSLFWWCYNEGHSDKQFAKMASMVEQLQKECNNETWWHEGLQCFPHLFV